MKTPVSAWKSALMVIGIALLAYLVMDFNSRMADLRRLSAKKEVVEAELTGLVRTQISLQTQIAYATSEQAVRDWAYESGHMVLPGDNPVVPLAPESATPVPTPTTAAPQPVVDNWQMWLWLFVDEGVPER